MSLWILAGFNVLACGLSSMPINNEAVSSTPQQWGNVYLSYNWIIAQNNQHHGFHWLHSLVTDARASKCNFVEKCLERKYFPLDTYRGFPLILSLYKYITPSFSLSSHPVFFLPPPQRPDSRCKLDAATNLLSCKRKPCKCKLQNTAILNEYKSLQGVYTPSLIWSYHRANIKYRTLPIELCLARLTTHNCWFKSPFGTSATLFELFWTVSPEAYRQK